MRPRLICPLVLVTLHMLLVPAPPAWAQKAAPAGDGKELVAVMDLQGVDARTSELAALSEELRAQLLQSGKFRVVDRQQIDTVLNE